MKYRGIVTVALKDGIFDPQGEAVKNSLHALGYNQVDKVRVGKHIVVYLSARNLDEARALLSEMANKLLANPVTETFRVDVEEVEERL